MLHLVLIKSIISKTVKSYLFLLKPTAETTLHLIFFNILFYLLIILYKDYLLNKDSTHNLEVIEIFATDPFSLQTCIKNLNR